jgi:hypothetical protein
VQTQTLTGNARHHPPAFRPPQPLRMKSKSTQTTFNLSCLKTTFVNADPPGF